MIIILFIFYTTTKHQGVLQVDAGIELWNSTDGLCGKMDGSPENDLSHNSVTSFTNKWLVNELNEICEPPITEIQNVSKEMIHKSTEFCSTIKSDRFKVCDSKHLDTHGYIEACKMDYIQCVMDGGSDCGCSSIAAYAEECYEKDQTSSWRDDKLCRK